MNSLDKKAIKDPAAVWGYLRRRSVEILTMDAPAIDFAAAQPFVLLIIGVNGSGKTTTIGKLASKLQSEGKKVLLAAGDTFRAAATEQLEVWGAKVGALVVRGKDGGDPSSVVFDGVKRARSEDIDVVIADTAGRLHTKKNLMEELQKVRQSGWQGPGRRAPRNLAGHRRNQWPERHRSGSGIHQGHVCDWESCSPNSTVPPRVG